MFVTIGSYTSCYPRAKPELIICLDGTWFKPDGSGALLGNRTNVAQVFVSIKEGKCEDQLTGRIVLQEKQYVEGIGAAEDLCSFDRLRAGVMGKGYEEKVRDAYEKCCQLNETDEIWLYGFSRGAYIARAVAGLLHHLLALRSAGKPSFGQEYREMLQMWKKWKSNPNGNAGERRVHFESKARKPPRIKFVGLFDTVKAVNDSDLYDIALNNSTEHVRHALAIHEERSHMEPQYIFPDISAGHERKGTFIQAWFAGSHIDIGGSAAKAGLALYPLQWILRESQLQGLCLGDAGSYGGRAKMDSPMEMVFPSKTSYSYKSMNGISCEMWDLQAIHDDTAFGERYKIFLNNKSQGWWPKSKREPFDKVKNLKGFNPDAPQGSIIHPSLYMLLDVDAAIAFASNRLGFQESIDCNRELMMGSNDRQITQGYWDSHEVVAIEKPSAIRILVCGNSGVGKSTLINEVFGAELAACWDRERGEHDIRVALTSENRPDLILHDSRGFESGRRDEFDVVEEFFREKSGAKNLTERLHMIWFCLPLDEDRPKQASTAQLFETAARFASEIPILVIGTKKDRYTDRMENEFRRGRRKNGLSVCEEEVVAYGEQKARERIQQLSNDMVGVAGARVDGCVAVTIEDPSTIKGLSETAAQCFTSQLIRLLFVRAQSSSIELKLCGAVDEVIRIYSHILRSATGAALIPMGASTNRYSAAIAVCAKVLQHFGLPTISAETAIEVIRAHVWENLGTQFAIVWAESIAILGLLLSVALSGLPIFLATSLINWPILVPATMRLYLMLSADLVLILTRSFKDAADRNIGQPRQQDLLAAAKHYRKYAKDVHAHIGRQVPRRNVLKCYKTTEISRMFRELVESYRVKMLEPETSAPSVDYKEEELGTEDLSVLKRLKQAIQSTSTKARK
ncbi:hypothetical protein KC318_g10053 [Hortaea werneckii]|nr:hypothetical protein KC334_g10889 [Hortaea werneckii]KAI7002178.1 hypothetical protein KC355_g9987 [Hortaea werneckii]KAI7660486.1 hypothetical protein KC318_g10053 [Hortaea werneckii]